MKEIRIYTTPSCPYCHAAKNLLTKKGLAFKEIDVSRDYALREKISKSVGGWSTVPMIFLGDDFIGGYQDLARLDMRGDLEERANSNQNQNSNPST